MFRSRIGWSGFLPELLPEPLVGIILSVIVYAVGSGLIEVLLQPDRGGVSI